MPVVIAEAIFWRKVENRPAFDGRALEAWLKEGTGRDLPEKLRRLMHQHEKKPEAPGNKHQCFEQRAATVLHHGVLPPGFYCANCTEVRLHVVLDDKSASKNKSGGAKFQKSDRTSLAAAWPLPPFRRSILPSASAPGRPAGRAFMSATVQDLHVNRARAARDQADA
ncbi:hypothetical protein [Methylocystis parvus]|uniref:hypothetical protein n=1 Tax=Methylocystis parvus TaxID=134 RepID=UPI003C765C2F